MKLGFKLSALVRAWLWGYMIIIPIGIGDDLLKWSNTFNSKIFHGICIALVVIVFPPLIFCFSNACVKAVEKEQNKNIEIKFSRATLIRMLVILLLVSGLLFIAIVFPKSHLADSPH